MKKEKIIVIGTLVFLVISIFYREIKLKNINTQEKKIVISENILSANNNITEKTSEIEIQTVEILENNKIELKKEIEIKNEISKELEEENHKVPLFVNDNINLEKKIILENLEYTIKKGDTIFDLSKEYKIKSDYIYANNIDKNLRVLQVGKKIKIPTESGIFYLVKKGDTFEILSKRFEINIKSIKDDNKIEKLLIGSKVFLREPKVSKYLNNFKEEYVKQSNLGSFSNPLTLMSLTSSFGSRKHPVLKKVLNHAGIDLRAKTGTKVVSTKNGVVSFAGRASGYGKLIIIKHPDGYETRYAHLSKIDVTKGQKVMKDEYIALSGATGRVSGPHLHFEIRKNGKIVNPGAYLKF
ncbi:MAG: peptidoglycan DD-metalloendopeptidase family protein [Cetobacterium sp.]